jgi:putative tricarboxylic transport membrane protein
MATFGVIAGCVGLDQVAGIPRFTFGITDLLDGIGIVPVVMGLFGISEVLMNIEREAHTRDIYEKKMNHSLGLSPGFQVC